MYSVNAPAVDCDFQSGIRLDNANQQKRTRKTVANVNISSQTGSNGELRPVEPSEIAAKILQMHSASEEMSEPEASRPQLIAGEEDASFEMPNVLLRPRKDPHYDGSPQNRSGAEIKTPKRAVTDRTGPSFKTLFLSTVVVAAVGGAALAFAMTDAFQDDGFAGRLVETELITPTPTIESLIAADERTIGAATGKELIPSEKTPAAHATEGQVSAAKQRIRNAFADGSAGNGFAVPSDQQKNHSDSLVSDKTQQRLTTAETPVTAPPESAQPGAYPLYASSAKTVQLPSEFVVRSNQVPAGSPELSRSDTSSSSLSNKAPQTETNGTIKETTYANTGTTLASVNMRQSEDKDATVIAVIPESTEVRFDECGKWWCGVSYDGRSGFVGQKYLERSVQKVE